MQEVIVIAGEHLTPITTDDEIERDGLIKQLVVRRRLIHNIGCQLPSVDFFIDIYDMNMRRLGVKAIKRYSAGLNDDKEIIRIGSEMYHEERYYQFEYINLLHEIARLASTRDVNLHQLPELDMGEECKKAVEIIRGRRARTKRERFFQREFSQEFGPYTLAYVMGVLRNCYIPFLMAEQVEKSSAEHCILLVDSCFPTTYFGNNNLYRIDLIHLDKAIAIGAVPKRLYSRIWEKMPDYAENAIKAA